MKYFFKCLMILFIGISISYIFILLGDKIFVEKNNVYISNALGAFFGSLFVFAFMEIKKMFDNRLTQVETNKKSLLKLKYKLKENLIICNDNLKKCSDFIKVIKSEGSFHDYRFVSFKKIDSEVLLDINNYNFVKRIFFINTDSYKINELSKKIFSYYYENKEVLEKSKYINEGFFMKDLELLKKYLESFDKNLIILLAKTNIIYKYINFLTIHSKDPFNFENRWKKELELLENKLSKVREEK